MIGYITKAEALDAGLTHEGTLFGVPAWFADDGTGEISIVTPKWPPLTVWCWLADKFYDLGSFFIPSDCQLEAPIRVTGKIAP